MIKINRKEDCVGCNACVQRCPKNCISMHEDEQGFLYPQVNLDLCIDCHLCEKVCPVINQAEPGKPLQTFAAKNLDDKIRKASSSGGIFFALAKNIIEDSGVVFGAKFNNRWEVVHAYSETLDGIKNFQGSKYVQSRIGESFLKAEEFLKAERRVMFTGTPCQIAGLKRFLRKDYPNLLTVDFVCHGVPSPLVWRDYLKYITQGQAILNEEKIRHQSTSRDAELPTITCIRFRDKRISWENFGLAIRTSSKLTSENNELLFEPLNKNLFMQGFLKDLYLRPSCYDCPAKQCKSHSDISLGDFWGIKSIDKDAHDSTGVSLILTNTQKGLDIFRQVIEWFKVESFEKAITLNPAIVHSCKKPKLYNEFWNNYSIDGVEAIAPIVNKIKPSYIKIISRRVLGKISRILTLK